MKKIVSKLKNNSLYILVPLIFISFFIININVTYFGDDYYYLTFGKLNFTGYFSELAVHYQEANGRFIVHMLATLFLKLPIFCWSIVNSLMLTGICYFIAKIISKDNTSKSPVILSCIFFFIATLDISITSQSTYWLTGSFNYIYTTFLLFAYWYSMLNVESKKGFFISIILGLLASATMEQSGMMVFGFSILTLLSKIDSFKDIKSLFKRNYKLTILSVVTLIGLCTVLLAPAQFARIELEDNNLPLSTTIKNNIKTFGHYYTANKLILPFCIVFNLTVLIYSIQKSSTTRNKIFISTLSLTNILLTILNIYIIPFKISNSYILIGVQCIIVLLYFISYIYINKTAYNKLLSPLTIAISLMVGSQLMMIISSVLGPRNLIFGLIMFAFSTSLIISKIKFKPIYQNILVTAFIIIGLTFNIRTSLGYYQTKIIDKQNISIISASADTLHDKSKEITLYKFINDNYSWSTPYISKYHEYWFKKFYNIENTIKWEYPS